MGSYQSKTKAEPELRSMFPVVLHIGLMEAWRRKQKDVVAHLGYRSERFLQLYSMGCIFKAKRFWNRS